jgi:eukaryotic-like serine/threonine-protein kinase
MASPPAAVLGVVANRYQLVRKFAESGQGEVYVARDKHEGDEVALKLLPPGTPGPWDEAQILRALRDPHILEIRNADTDPGRGQDFIVTEYLPGGSLDARLDASGNCGLLVDEVVRFIRQACNGIARAHAERLVHNDIKPANLFINPEGECLVADFGGATLIPAGANVTLPRAVTASTLAPEVAVDAWGTPAASVRSDIYSLGATAYWLLAARPPIDVRGVFGPPAHARVVAETPPRLFDVAPHVPAFVARAIETAIARDPNDRFASAGDLHAALGGRPEGSRIWSRTDHHGAHAGCWTGVPRGGGSTYELCITDGPRANQVMITTRHQSSGNRITKGCRTTGRSGWAQAIRSVIKALG